MNALIFNKKKFASLKKYILDKRILSSECELYFFECINNKKVLKIFYIDEGLSFGNKLLTINTLIDNKKHINIEELVMPEKLVIVNSKVVGFSMPYISNINLKLILDDPAISIKVKIKYLKQVGKILERVQKVKIENQRFHLGDVHESNFIVESKTDRIRVVDLDGSKIVNNKSPIIKYMALNPDIENMPYKYPQDRDGSYIACSNTDILCYNFMILNTISGKKINMCSAAEYYLYLNYLRSLNFDYELLDCFNNVYTAHNNIFPTDVLDLMPNDVFSACYSIFQEKVKLK